MNVWLFFLIKYWNIPLVKPRYAHKNEQSPNPGLEFVNYNRPCPLALGATRIFSLWSDGLFAIGVKNAFKEKTFPDVFFGEGEKWLDPKDRYGHPSLRYGSASEDSQETYYGGWLRRAKNKTIEIYVHSGRYTYGMREQSPQHREILEAAVADVLLSAYGVEQVIFMHPISARFDPSDLERFISGRDCENTRAAYFYDKKAVANLVDRYWRTLRPKMTSALHAAYEQLKRTPWLTSESDTLCESFSDPHERELRHRLGEIKRLAQHSPVVRFAETDRKVRLCFLIKDSRSLFSREKIIFAPKKVWEDVYSRFFSLTPLPDEPGGASSSADAFFLIKEVADLAGNSSQAGIHGDLEPNMALSDSFLLPGC